MELDQVGDERAVLYGYDHEYSNTYFGPAAAYFAMPETDLLDGAPEWWRAALPNGREPWEAIGFVYGYEDANWGRAHYDVDDGFGKLDPPVVSEQSFYREVTDFVSQSAEGDHRTAFAPSPEALQDLAAAGPDLTAEQLEQVFGPVSADLISGVEAARAFR